MRLWQIYIEHQRIDYIQHHLNQHRQARIQLLIKQYQVRTFIIYFKQWKYQIQQQISYKTTLINKYVHKMIFHQQWICYRKWCLYIEQMKINYFKSNLTHENQQLKLQLIKHQKLAGKIIIKKWSLQLQYQFFNKWKQWNITRQNYKYELMDKYILKLYYKSLWSYHRKWMLWIETDKVKQLQDKIKDIQAISSHKLIKRWQSVTQITFFNKWYQYIQQMKHIKQAILHKTIHRLINNQLYSSWFIWNKYIDTIHQQLFTTNLTTQIRHNTTQYKMNLFIKQLKYKQYIKHFNSWKIYSITRSLKKKELLTFYLKRLLNIQLFHSYRQWKLYIEDIKYKQLQLVLNQKKNYAVENFIKNFV